MLGYHKEMMSLPKHLWVAIVPFSTEQVQILLSIKVMEACQFYFLMSAMPSH